MEAAELALSDLAISRESRRVPGDIGVYRY